MPEDKIRDMIFELIKEVDYDLGQSLDPNFSEDLDESEATMSKLVAIVNKHLKG